MKPSQPLASRTLRAIAILSLAAGVPMCPTMADNFGTGDHAFTLDFVRIGNPGNEADPVGSVFGGGRYGDVAYSYQMGTYEVSRDHILKANQSGGLGLPLADLTDLGGNAGPRPATGLSWYQAAAFVNWLNTSTGHAAAYNLSGGALSLWTPAEAWVLGGENRYRHKDAHYFLPSEDEWYKAAYHHGTAYFKFPTQGNTAPLSVAGGTAPGTAVYDRSLDSGPADVTNAGGLSPYGTMAQAGNVFEWLESASDGSNDSGTERRVLRGGDWTLDSAFDLSAASRATFDPSVQARFLGFRVAAIPEPAESAGVLGALALGLVLWLRRPRRV